MQNQTNNVVKNEILSEKSKKPTFIGSTTVSAKEIGTGEENTFSYPVEGYDSLYVGIQSKNDSTSSQIVAVSRVWLTP